MSGCVLHIMLSLATPHVLPKNTGAMHDIKHETLVRHKMLYHKARVWYSITKIYIWLPNNILRVHVLWLTNINLRTHSYIKCPLHDCQIFPEK